MIENNTSWLRSRSTNIRAQLIWTALALGLLGLAAFVIFMVRAPAPIEGLTILERQTRGHNDDIVIVSGERPPAGGIHHDSWQNCGIYREPIADERAVHSLEHGAVWITYRPDLEDTEIAHLEELVRDQPYLLLSPYPTQRSPLVLTAWGVQLELQSAYDDRVEAFIGRYRLGPTIPERGAACSGGVGEPLE